MAVSNSSHRGFGKLAPARGRWLASTISALDRAGLNVYTLRIYLTRGIAVKRARIFKSGNSQAVRLPKEFRFKVSEVEILRRGEEIILREPKRSLAQAFRALASMPQDFMAEGRIDPPPEDREGL